MDNDGLMIYYLLKDSNESNEKDKEREKNPKPIKRINNNNTITINKAEREKRIKLFNTAKIKMKESFFGIDSVIDEIFTIIETWFIYPEYMLRPTIVNLYGLTGVGKTDFVKRLSKFLELNDKTCIIELDCDTNSLQDKYDYERPNSSIIEEIQYNTDIKPCDKSILLLDEMHRFASKNNNNNKKYSDVWKLLSDGSLYNESTILLLLKKEIKRLEIRYSEIKNTMMNTVESFDEKIKYLYDINEKYPSDNSGADTTKRLPKNFINTMDNNAPKSSPIEVFNKYESNYNYIIDRIESLIDFDQEDIDFIKKYKMIYQGPESLIQLMNKDFLNNSGDRITLLRSSSNRVLLEWMKFKVEKLNKEYENKDEVENRMRDMKYIYSKMLIFICGNLSKKDYENKTPTVDDIKKILKESSLRPEQISRFGNNYIIYPVLTKEDYDAIILKEIKFVEEKLQKDFNNKNIKIDTKLVLEKIDLGENYIYEGVRPVYSAVHRAISEIIPPLLIKLNEK